MVAVWTSKDACDAFIGGTLVPTLQTAQGVFAGPPQRRAAEVVNLQTA